MRVFLLLILTIASYSFTSAQTFDPEKVLWAADWSPDGKHIAVGGNQGVVRILSAGDLDKVDTFAIAGTVTKIKWHPEEPLLAITAQSSGESALIIKVTTGDTVKFNNISTNGARGLDWSPDGQLIAIGDNDGQLSIFSRSGDLIKSLETDPKSITGLSWHPHDSLIVTVGSRISIYNIHTDSLQVIHPRDVEILMLCVDWHPSGEFFATGDYGDYELHHPALLQLRDSNGVLLAEIEGSKAEYRNLEWTNDGKRLVTASDGIRIWDQTGRLLESALQDELFWGVDWNSSAKRIIATTGTGEIFLLDERVQVIQVD